MNLVEEKLSSSMASGLDRDPENLRMMVIFKSNARNKDLDGQVIMSELSRSRHIREVKVTPDPNGKVI